MKIKIRTAHILDLQTIQKLLIKSWHTTYDQLYGADRVTDLCSRWHSLANLSRQIVAPDTTRLIALQNDLMVGTALFKTLKPNSVLLNQLYIDPDQQGLGIGSKLLDEVIKQVPDAAQINLEVDPSNKNAIDFYTVRGFRTTGTSEECGSAGDQIAVLLMTRKL